MGWSVARFDSPNLSSFVFESERDGREGHGCFSIALDCPFPRSPLFELKLIALRMSPSSFACPLLVPGARCTSPASVARSRRPPHGPDVCRKSTTSAASPRRPLQVPDVCCRPQRPLKVPGVCCKSPVSAASPRRPLRAPGVRYARRLLCTVSAMRRLLHTASAT